MKEKAYYGGRILAAAAAAILLAMGMQLQFALSAGIVAILSVTPTKRETLRTALARLLAFGCAMVLAWGCFALLGCGTPAFLLYLSLFIPLCLWRGWHSAMAMDSVLITHFISLGGIHGVSLRNELLIFAIGAGCGVLVNLLLRSDRQRLSALTSRLDEQIRETLRRMGHRMLDSNLPDYDGRCIQGLREAGAEAMRQARLNVSNSLTEQGDDTAYIAMRLSQIDLLQEMYHQVSSLRTTPETAARLARFIGLVSEEYHRDNKVLSLLEAWDALNLQMKQAPLPASRQEFEDRASLFVFMGLLRRFLVVKRDYAAAHS